MCQGIWLGDDSYEYLKGEAIHCVVHYDLQYPVNSFELADKLNFIVKSYDELDDYQRSKLLEASEDGYFIDDGRRTIIFYNKVGCPEREDVSRFHEIGHAVLDHGLDESKKDIEETEAKFFAKYIKAPPPLIHQLPYISQESIRLAFELSYEAAENAFNYYQKWLKKFSGTYKEYEVKLLIHCGFDYVLEQNAAL